MNIYIMVQDLNEIYTALYEKYEVMYPHDPMGVLKYHLLRSKLSLEAGLIYLAVKNGIRIPEIELLISEGKDLEEASKLVSKDAKIDPSIVKKFERPPPRPLGFKKVQIVDCDDLLEDWKVSLYGRVIALYVGKPLYKEFGIDEKLQFVLNDRSGLILVEVDHPLDITLMRGSVVKINGKVKTYDGKRYISATNVVKLQTVEDGFHELSIIEMKNINQLPEIEKNRLVKPLEAKLAETVTVGKERRIDFLIYGFVLCFLSFFIPFIGILTCIAGFILIILGMTTESPKVKGFENINSFVELLIEHHPPWLRSRCLSLKLFNKRIYVCARCTGTILGVIIASIISFKFSNPYVIALLVLPTMIDWGTQKLCLRESSNSLRVLTGFSLGMALNYSKYLNFNIRFIIASMFLITISLITYSSSKTISSQTSIIKTVEMNALNFSITDSKS